MPINLPKKNVITHEEILKQRLVYDQSHYAPLILDTRNTSLAKGVHDESTCEWVQQHERKDA